MELELFVPLDPLEEQEKVDRAPLEHRSCSGAGTEHYCSRLREVGDTDTQGTGQDVVQLQPPSKQQTFSAGVFSESFLDF